MPYDEYSALRVEVDAGVAHATIDNPPVNVLDTRLIADLGRFAAAVEPVPYDLAGGGLDGRDSAEAGEGGLAT